MERTSPVSGGEDGAGSSRAVLPRAPLVAWIAMSAPVVAVSCALLFVARTLEGRAAALFSLSVVVAIGLALASKRRAAIASLVLALVAGVLLLVRAPKTESDPSASTRLVLVGPLGARPWRFAPTNVVPERDQLALATVLVPMADALMTRASAARLRVATNAVYDEVDGDPTLSALPSAMGDAIFDRDSGRVFVFEPAHERGERRPAILFLHGSAGSWKGYFSVFLAIARAERWALAQPSFGFGHWNAPAGLDAVERARAWLASQPWVDPAQIHLVCLSNGGRAATRIIASSERRYRSVVWLSSVIERSVIDARDWPASWRGAPMLVLHGTQDDRLPLDYIHRAADALSSRGAVVQREVFAGEDHYLVFTQRTRVASTIARWIKDGGGR